MALVLGLYVLFIGGVVGLLALIFSHPFIDVAVDLAPAILLFLGATIIHGLRHDLDT